MFSLSQLVDNRHGQRVQVMVGVDDVARGRTRGLKTGECTLKVTLFQHCTKVIHGIFEEAQQRNRIDGVTGDAQGHADRVYHL